MPCSPTRQIRSRGKQVRSPRQYRRRLTSAAMSCCLRKSEAEEAAMPAVINPGQTEAPMRAALYFRVSTGRQAEADLSIPDQRRQALAYCAARGWEVALEFVEPGMSGTDDRRPELQRLLDMASAGGAPFDVVLVHSFGRFARDHFALELHVRRLRKAGVRLVSITQDLGEDPMSVMVRQVFALFDEYQSKENAKHNFLGFSYGFRPGRGTHDALDALCVGIDHTKVNWVLDADIRSFFDEVGQGMGDSFSEASNRRSAHHPPDPEMVEGGRTGRRSRDR